MLSPNAPWPSCEITVWSPTGTTPYLCARYVDPAKKLPRMTPIQPSVTAAFLDSGGLKAATPSETASTPVSAAHPDENARSKSHDDTSSRAPCPRVATPGQQPSGCTMLTTSSNPNIAMKN